jgi:hypothetical protein
LGCLAIVVSQILRLGFFSWFALVLIWEVPLFIWVSLPGALVVVALLGDGNHESGLLAILSIGVAIWAYFSVIFELVAIGENLALDKRLKLTASALVVAWVSSMVLIYAKPLPLAGGNTGHWTVILLGGTWAIFGIIISTIVSEGILWSLDGLRWVQSKVRGGILGHTAILLAIQCGHHSIVNMLIGYRANIEAHDAKGQTALLLAVQCNHPSIVEMLLRKGARLKAKDKSGQTAELKAKDLKNDTEAKIRIVENPATHALTDVLRKQEEILAHIAKYAQMR